MMRIYERTGRQNMDENADKVKDETTQKRQRVKRRKVLVTPVHEYNATRIKKVRESINISPTIFAEALGVSLKTVEAWESGRNTPKGPTARILQLLEQNRYLLDEHQILQ